MPGSGPVAGACLRGGLGCKPEWEHSGGSTLRLPLLRASPPCRLCPSVLEIPLHSLPCRPTSRLPACLQCADLVPQEQEEGALDAQGLPIGWGHYQLWWQTVLARVAPELQRLGWSNVRCVGGGGVL